MKPKAVISLSNKTRIRINGSGIQWIGGSDSAQFNGLHCPAFKCPEFRTGIRSNEVLSESLR